MYYVYNRLTDKLVLKTTEIRLLKLYSPLLYAVVIL